jgi:ribosome-binding factor A
MAKDKKMGPPSKKELVDKARDAIQSQEERKTLFPTSDIRQSTDKKLGDPKTYFTGRQHSTEESLKAQKKSRKKLNKEITKEARAKQVPKSMNMGGVLKNRGGMFKGTY